MCPHTRIIIIQIAVGHKIEVGEIEGDEYGNDGASVLFSTPIHYFQGYIEGWPKRERIDSNYH